MNLLDLLDELARNYGVNSKIDYDKLDSFFQAVSESHDQRDMGSLFVIVKHYPDDPLRDTKVRMLRAIDNSDALSRTGTVLVNPTSDYLFKVYAVSSLDGWIGSDEGDVDVFNGDVTFTPDTSKTALQKFSASRRPKRTYNIVRKHSGSYQVLYNGAVWVEAHTAEQALTEIGQQIDRFL